MTNADFLHAIRASFKTYLALDSSRSTEKLKALHGHIAQDVQALFGEEYTVQSLGYQKGCEAIVSGRYYPKKVDITVSRAGKPVACYAVKFAMRNYSQNSNNYFENMLGETANIRANNIPYFQIFILFEKVPYYKKGGTFMRYDVITEHNLAKYVTLSKDSPDAYAHTPDKTLIVLLRLKEKAPGYAFADSHEYAAYYQSALDEADALAYSDQLTAPFASPIIANDYARFLAQTRHIALQRA